MWMPFPGHPDVWLAAGWDQNLQTYYAVCWDLRDTRSGPVFHVGTVRDAIRSPVELSNLLPFWPMLEEVLVTLQHDKERCLALRKSIELPPGLRERLDAASAERHLDIPETVYQERDRLSARAAQRDLEKNLDVERLRPKRDRMH